MLNMMDAAKRLGTVHCKVDAFLLSTAISAL
jgi:hypothetical protein